MTDLVLTESSPAVEAMGWILVNSLWQGTAVAAALAAGMRLLDRASAQSRYVAACVAMALLIAPPCSVICRAMFHAELPARRLSTSELARPELVHTLAARSVTDSSLDLIRPLFPLIVALWVAGACFFSLRLLGGWALTRRWLYRDAHPLALPFVDRLRNRIGIRRAVILRQSSFVDVPMVIGWLRPVLVVPVAALSGLSAPELETILAHELAHIRRHDYLVNLFQCVVEILMFYHPATWWISAVIRREREHCCDDAAVAASGDRFTYARALAALEGLRCPAFSLSQAATGGDLAGRVRRILNSQEESMKSLRILVAPVVFLVIAPIWLARADDRPAGPSATPATTSPQKVGVIRDALDITGVSDEPTKRPAALPTGTDSREKSAVLSPPNESEVWNEVVKTSNARHPGRIIQRDNVRILIEKIGDKTDAVKIYPLAGPCQLVHAHYKCTALFDEMWKAGDHNSVTQVDHRTEVVYIDKNYLKRPPAPARSAKDVHDPIDQALREIEQLKRKLEHDRHEQERMIDGLIKELEDIKRRPVSMIDDEEAEKTFHVGMYYKRIGKMAAADFYFGKTVSRWPDSSWAARASRERSSSLPVAGGGTQS